MRKEPTQESQEMGQGSGGLISWRRSPAWQTHVSLGPESKSQSIKDRGEFPGSGKMDPKIHNKGEVGEFEELKGIKTLWRSGWRESESLKMLT